MRADEVAEKPLVGQGVFLEAGKVNVAAVLAHPCQEKKRRANDNLYQGLVMDGESRRRGGRRGMMLRSQDGLCRFEQSS